jgi:zinc transport system ATP-binding protein
MMTTRLLEATDLVAGYRRPVVGPLSFRIQPGEVVGIWGANGCGKSTLLKALAGSARLFGGRVNRRPGLTFAWQTQEPVRLDEMPFSGWEYLGYGEANRSPPDLLRNWLDRRIDSLSGGQFQLLAAWAILATRADLVLLDEPTNNLDPEGETLLADMLRSEQGHRAVLLVSHERHFLQQACNRVLEITP